MTPIPRPAPAVLLWAALAVLPPAASAAGQTTFELTDGSVVTGDLVGIDADGYTLRSPSLGTLRIEQADVRVMRQGAATATNDAARDDIAAMQRQLATDPDILALIMGLRDDPALSAAIADPALMQAITSGDLRAVENNDRFRELMEHPGIRAIIERVQGR